MSCGGSVAGLDGVAARIFEGHAIGLVCVIHGRGPFLGPPDFLWFRLVLSLCWTGICRHGLRLRLCCTGTGVLMVMGLGLSLEHPTAMEQTIRTAANTSALAFLPQVRKLVFLECCSA